MGDGLMRWVTGGPLAFQHKVATEGEKSNDVRHFFFQQNDAATIFDLGS